MHPVPTGFLKILSDVPRQFSRVVRHESMRARVWESSLELAIISAIT